LGARRVVVGGVSKQSSALLRALGFGAHRSCCVGVTCENWDVGETSTVSVMYVRHGTTTLFAALEVATGKVTDACMHRHRHQEFLRFLKQVAKAYPRVKLHIVADNYATHKHPKVKAWLDRNPRITMHFTPTSGSWMNMVEIFFGIITRQAIRRGSFASVRELTDTIGRFIDAWNERCEPFIWTKDADAILAKAQRSTKAKDSALTRH
jgi:transposase